MTQDPDKTRRAMRVLLRRLANPDQPGFFDVEAAWTIGVLALALNITDNEIAEMGGDQVSAVYFATCGGLKIKVIQKLREIAHPYGLREAKDLAEGTITLRLPAMKAQRIKAECEAISPGCQVEITAIRVSDAKNNKFTPSA